LDQLQPGNKCRVIKLMIHDQLGQRLLAMSIPAFVHFQMIYTREAAMNKGGKIPVVLVFTHPFEADHTMDMR